MNPSSKSMMDYMTEMNRLFPRSPGDDLFQTPNTSHSPFSHLTPANRSSSSADSTSPDSFPDLFHHRLSSEYRHEHDQPTFETPLAIRRQRPIVGRKIMQTEPTFNQAKSLDIDLAIWQPDGQQTPPGTRNVFIENKNYTQNVYYELFPAENRAYEFKTPVKTPCKIPSPMSNYTPNVANVSPSTSNMPISNVSPTLNRARYPSRFPSPALSLASSGPSSSFGQDVGPSRMCTFCRKNGETPLVYMTHMVKERVGQRQIVTCPILRSHVCSTCGASGDNAHTITYCPILRHSNNGQPLQSTTITLKNTRIKSNGRRRY